MPHKAETEVSIIVNNRFSDDLSLTVDLSKNADYFELSEERVEFPRVRPGRTIGESVTVKPKFMGDFDFTITASSDKGSFTKTVPVKVTKTARQTPSGIPTSLTRTPVFNPVDALQELYSDFQYIGEGGFAKVFKARRRDNGRIVALKIPRIDRKTSALFIKEVAAWYNLNHENIVRLYKAGILPVPYLEMEFVEGAEVNGKLVRNLDEYPKPVEEKTALQLIRGIAKGLAHAHSKGIYHLDLKPLNILLKADLTPKITDWGLAKISARSSLSTHSGYSPLYAAPEQLDEETFGAPDHRTDIYQLGLIFYELLTGKPPYEATSPAALFGKILQAKPTPPQRLIQPLPSTTVFLKSFWRRQRRSVIRVWMSS